MGRQRKWLIGLAGGTMLMSSLAIWQEWQAQMPDLTYRRGEALFPYAQDQAASVAMIVLTKADNMTTLMRKQDQWMLQTEEGLQPANLAKVRQLMMQLTQATYKEPKTARLALLSELSLADPAQEGKGVGTHIQFYNAHGDVLAELIAGREGKNFRGTSYVRFPHSNQSWLIQGKFPNQASQQYWEDSTLFEIPKEAIKSVRILQPDGEQLYMLKERQDAMGFTLANLLSSQQELKRDAMEEVASAFSQLTALAAVPRHQWQYRLGQVVEATYRTFDDRLITAYLSPQEDGRILVAFEMESAGEVEDVVWQQRKKQMREWVYELSDQAYERLMARPKDLLVP